MKQRPYLSYFSLDFSLSTSSWTHRSLRALRHGGDPLDATGREEPCGKHPSLSFRPYLHFFLDAPSLRALRHGGDPLDAPDGLGLQLRIIAVSVLQSGKPQTNSLPVRSATVSVARAFGTARPPLRVPTALGDVLARKALIKCG